ncbi:(Dimethylallyl)adenosine tRNA methylthiotransferase MiaB [Sporotomaculum syntrophicum]|uniref:tRNA-2-methylthio-N(6)-dimethylallyladenosine synthase n=2 Tax=Sporotomaculum syntrophicum TaxID=182264 RepID=A0A9D2WPN6_9FIRM|nr:(Dimethylallyl)adenosine tRNA methylthiotransferase MiaB [Sporotomaculum syntrophicum]
MNEHDSELIAGMLENKGYFLAEGQNDADIIVLNTCCVRETAENKVFGLLGRLGKLKKQKPHLIIAMGGCMSQQEHIATKIKQRFKYVDILFGTHNIHMLPDLIDQAEEQKKQVIDIWSERKDIQEGLTVKRFQGFRAWVSIMFGCNNFCTYCIVPYVRGREKSRQPEDIIKEIKELVNNGYCEVTLLGQNVNSYGKDFNPVIDFSDLLIKINAIDGLKRIRYMTSHPKDFSDKLIMTIAQLNKICEHIHLPVQSGSNKILRKMNRGYTREDYLKLVKKIRTAVPNVSLTTDIIVGFPGETDDDFSDTIDLIKDVEFDSAFTFIYNKRQGTPAAAMEEQIPDSVKISRIEKLIALQNEISLRRNNMEVSKTHLCLVEGPSKTNANLMSARTSTNKIVIFQGNKELVGSLVLLRITGYGLTHLEGEVISE